MRGLTIAFVSAAVALPWAPAVGQGTPTEITVRVIAHDAKIIGSGVGGARIEIRDAQSGDLLASGVQEGSTGDTRLIMSEPRLRGQAVFDTEGAAGFHFTLHLERPTMVEIAASGPLGTTHAIQRASKTTLLVPGRHVRGDGFVLELMGFTVTLDGVPEIAEPGEDIAITSSVTMLCGCPTEPGGMWDADHITVLARVVRDGKVEAESEMEFTGTRSTYAGQIRVGSPGPVEIQVIAADESTGNFGMVTRALTVGETR